MSTPENQGREGRPVTPTELVGALAGAAPSDLSRAPLLGILGVVMGAGIVTLTGRMITLGLPDLKGHLGISFDQGAWLGTAFNCALMFIGPITVFIGGLLGPRSILLWCAATFTLICAFLPLIHNYSFLITALIFAGLASGTFYPLTLTFALRNIPLKYLPFTLALYATFVDMSVNIAPSLYGWYRDHLSWKWMFWNSAVITPPMMLCIYYGIPAVAAPKKSPAAPSFMGLLYGGLAFALFFAALDQGERLDWWRSGVITSLAVAGLILLVASGVRRLRGPNPLVHLKFLLSRDTLLLGTGLILFRFCLLSTIIVIPQSLGIQNFEADQIGPAVVWTAAAQLAVACVAALLLLRKLDSRLLMAVGFTCVAFACVMNSTFTSVWASANYYRTELLMAVGQSFAFVGLVATIVLHAIFSGALMRPPPILTYSAYFHLVRLFGGQLGVSFMTHFIAQREKFHSNLLGLHVQHGSWITDNDLAGLVAGLFAGSSGHPAAVARALDIVTGRTRLQAYTLALSEAFQLVAIGCFVGLLIAASIRKSPLGYGDFGAFRQGRNGRQNG
jgi:MFS transporter, DHA2 family, multidrug resistance protein